jgi:hypothetical protein
MKNINVDFHLYHRLHVADAPGRILEEVHGGSFRVENV